MSEEQQPQRQQSHQPQLQQRKFNKEQSSSVSSSPPKASIHELCNQDYVSRLLAATPAYLYCAPVGPNNFFFSDMLRSLVQTRNNENTRNFQLQKQSILSRRPRKGTWSQHRPYDHLRDCKVVEEKQLAHSTIISAGCKSMSEKPLELTNKPFFQLSSKYNKSMILKGALPEVVDAESRKSPSLEYEQNTASDCIPAVGGGVAAVLQHTPPAASLPPQDLVLPPPPPVWYPPLYSPYGIDPLHFFIDLRVSGHIYDRKKENVSPLTSAENNSSTSNESEKSTVATVSLLNKRRHGSAFTVPVPRSNEVTKADSTGDAINLSANKFENYAKYYDLGESKENRPGPKSNYTLQHLPRPYSRFAAHDFLSATTSAEITNFFENDSKSDTDCDADSVDGCVSADNFEDNGANLERDIDVEMIDSIKYRTDGESSHCSSSESATLID